MRLQGTTVLIKPDTPPEKTKGGILITSKKKSRTGVILNRGPGCEIVTIGDRVHYTPKKANIMEIEGIDHHFISEGDIVYIF